MVTVNRRYGDGNYSNNLTVANGAINKIKFYAYNMQSGDSAQPYFNDLLIVTPAEDLVRPTINLAEGVDKVTWVAKNNGTIYPANSDVSATDNSGTANVTFSPATVSTVTDGLTTVTYTATDPSGNTATVTRVIAVGSASPGFHNLRFPVSITVNTNSSDFAYGQIYIDGATPGVGAASGIQAWIGVNSANTDPATWGASAWTAASYIGEEGNDDNFRGTISGVGRTPGTYYYATRFRLGTNDSNTNYFYGGIGDDGVGGGWGGTHQQVVGAATNTITHGNGVLTVVPVRNVSFAVDMNVQMSKGFFVPSSAQRVELKGSYNGGWTAAGILMTDPEGDGIYTVTVPIQGNSGDSISYKFQVTGSLPGGLGWEGGSDRFLVLGSSAETLKPVTFGNDGITFAVWSSGATLNSANLAKYAIGGATSLTSSDGKAPTASSDATTLTLTAIVRDDASLSVVGEAVTSLENFNNPSLITPATVSDAADQTLLPANCKRKVFSVTRGTDDRKFLRVRVTKP